MTLEELQDAIEKYDRLLRPYILYINPNDAELLGDAIEEIKDRSVIVKTVFVEQGKCYVADRNKIEECCGGLRI